MSKADRAIKKALDAVDRTKATCEDERLTDLQGLCADAQVPLVEAMRQVERANRTK